MKAGKETNKKPDDLIVTEQFMAKKGKNGWNRCFYGTLNRKHVSHDDFRVFGKVRVKSGVIWSMAASSESWEEAYDLLAENMDGMVELIIDRGIHNDAGEFIETPWEKFFLN